ncbi:hypothetical protein [Lewinella cohaerens]|uniref:hypothetical protein n=1 Tax=Lewinella cohaerens TaxID=70995 RepID=UPI0003705535|nr:hypothetical protein [Lewinella cohaerens]
MYDINLVLQFGNRRLQLIVTCTLFLGIFSSLAGQHNDQLIEIIRLHIQPGQETAFISENVNRANAFSARLDAPFYVYVYDDHTLEWGTLIHGETEKLTNQPAIPTKFTGAVNQQESKGIHYHAALSHSNQVDFLPAKISGAPYLEVVTYRVHSSDRTEMMDKLRKIATSLRALNSPVEYDCYTYAAEDNMIIFELVYPADDPDGLATRRANQAAKSNKSLQRWYQEIGFLADQVSKVTGRYVYELSREIAQQALTQQH